MESQPPHDVSAVLYCSMLLQVTAHPECVVRIYVASQQKYFKVIGLAVLPYTDQLPRTVLDQYLNI
jgi:hypothetical protein